MSKVENDTTRDPTPAVIIAGPRTGGTFLAHGLSNHPNIYCERQEVMHVNSSYRSVGDDITPVDILRMVWAQVGYSVSCCKLQYSQAGYNHVWETIVDLGARVVHLRRHNKLRQAVSLIINQMVRDGALPFHPQHTRSTPKKIAVTIEPERLERTAKKLVAQEHQWQERIAASGLPVLRVSYRSVIGEGVISAQQVAPAAAERLCNFLGVVRAPMLVGLRRVNPWRLDRMIANWSDIEPLVGKPEFVSQGEAL